MKRLFVLALLASAAAAESPYQFREVSPQSLELRENGQPVFVYNHGRMTKEGVPEDRYRCCYVHPVYAPNGVVATDDFPTDHYHHRGIFWAWPIVEIDGERRDLWLMNGIRKRFGRWLARETAADSARLAVENGWFVGDEKAVREQVEIVAQRAEGDRRRLDFTLRFDSLGKTIRLQGAPEEAKGYGGFSVRFAPREQTAITTDTGRETEDTNMVPHAWAREDGIFENGRAGLRIDVDPANPGYPNGWCLRRYGFLGVNFPGNEAYELQPGQPLTLRYSVTLIAGDEQGDTR
jgi:hypothetical protein